jgi:hypothetical protein
MAKLKALTIDGQRFDLTAKADLVNGKVPAEQLPSYVDDVLEFANLAALPATGESGKIYVTIDDRKTFRWGGTQYVNLSSPAIKFGFVSQTITNTGGIASGKTAAWKDVYGNIFISFSATLIIPRVSIDPQILLTLPSDFLGGKVGQRNIDIVKNDGTGYSNSAQMVVQGTTVRLVGTVGSYYGDLYDKVGAYIVIPSDVE